MKLTLIGYWASEHEEGWPDAHQFVDPSWDGWARGMATRYLAGGFTTRIYMGWSECRLCGKPNGTSELTDGVYIWPEGLSHYVGEHGVRLPDRFVRHVVDASTRLDEAEVDSGWWSRVTGPDSP